MWHKKLLYTLSMCFAGSTLLQGSALQNLFADHTSNSHTLQKRQEIVASKMNSARGMQWAGALGLASYFGYAVKGKWQQQPLNLLFPKKHIAGTSAALATSLLGWYWQRSLKTEAQAIKQQDRVAKRAAAAKERAQKLTEQQDAERKAEEDNAAAEAAEIKRLQDALQAAAQRIREEKQEEAAARERAQRLAEQHAAEQAAAKKAAEDKAAADAAELQRLEEAQRAAKHKAWLDAIAAQNKIAEDAAEAKREEERQEAKRRADERERTFAALRAVDEAADLAFAQRQAEAQKAAEDKRMADQAAEAKRQEDERIVRQRIAAEQKAREDKEQRDEFEHRRAEIRRLAEEGRRILPEKQREEKAAEDKRAAEGKAAAEPKRLAQEQTKILLEAFDPVLKECQDIALQFYQTAQIAEAEQSDGLLEILLSANNLSRLATMADVYHKNQAPKDNTDRDHINPDVLIAIDHQILAIFRSIQMDTPRIPILAYNRRFTTMLQTMHQHFESRKTADADLTRELETFRKNLAKRPTIAEEKKA